MTHAEIEFLHISLPMRKRDPLSATFAEIEEKFVTKKTRGSGVAAAVSGPHQALSATFAEIEVKTPKGGKTE